MFLVPPRRPNHVELRRGNAPSNLLDEVADERSALAEVALGAANTGLVDAGSRLLQTGEEQT